MIIINYKDIDLKYNEILNKCKATGEPVFLMNNDQVDLVVMDVNSFKRREKKLCMQQLVLESYASRLAGENDYSLDESKELINDLLQE